MRVCRTTWFVVSHQKGTDGERNERVVSTRVVTTRSVDDDDSIFVRGIRYQWSGGHYSRGFLTKYHDMRLHDVT